MRGGRGGWWVYHACMYGWVDGLVVWMVWVGECMGSNMDRKDFRVYNILIFIFFYFLDYFFFRFFLIYIYLGGYLSNREEWIDG